ncbi:hypothetical protein GCM10023222_56130 [Saccharopolyspora cebuensis]
MRITRGLWSPVADLDVTNPRKLLQSDKSVALLVFFAFPVAMAAFPALLIFIDVVIAHSDPSGSYSVSHFSFSDWVVMPGIGATIGTGFLLDSAWWNFVVARLWLWLRGRLPLRLMRFLDDGRERQVFRQSGTVYQFRHARLHDRLLHG